MSIAESKIDQTVDEILVLVDANSKYYGKLLNWKGSDGFWHYGIGLSDQKIFDTGRGMKPFDSDHVKAKFVKGIDSIEFPPEKTIKRLLYALKRFHQWEYGLLGWNCEHLARLVATNRAISYEVKKQPWPIPDLNHKGKHPHAKKDFHEYLSKVDSDLLSREAMWFLSYLRSVLSDLQDNSPSSHTLPIYPPT